MSQDPHQFLCLYGHFYQPPREDPFTGRIAPEHGAAPYENFNEKITAECYRPNAELGNFEHISFDLGPTLAAWLERAHPDVHARIVAADRAHLARYGVGNALAQAYNHTILPLASTRDKYTQITWGLDDFAHRFGHPAQGMWLAETAVDLETLAIAAELGVTYTVLAPWQAAEAIDITEPYRVALPNGRSITVFFYNGPLSGGVSFDWDTTTNADTFAAAYLLEHFNTEKTNQHTDQLIVVATDGELYGHHKPLRDHFLQHLVQSGAAAVGVEVTTLGHYLQTHQPQREVQLHVPSAWSCAHGVARWGTGCDCTEGDAAWKPALRKAFENLSASLNDIFERESARTLEDPWAARNGYLAYRNGWISRNEFWSRFGKSNSIWPRFGKNSGKPMSKNAEQRTELLLASQYFGQWMYTSCGFFFEDLDRIEPVNDIAFARRAISLVRQATKIDLEAEFLHDLAAAKSWRNGQTGADLYHKLPSIKQEKSPARKRAAVHRVA